MPSAKKIEIEGKPALEVEITFPVPKTAGNPMADKMMQAMFGPDKKSTVYLVKGDEKTIYFSLGASQEKLLQAIALGKEEKKSLAADADVAATIALLPAGAWRQRDQPPRLYRPDPTGHGNRDGREWTLDEDTAFPEVPAVRRGLQSRAGRTLGGVHYPGGIDQGRGEYIATMRQGVLGAPQPQVP